MTETFSDDEVLEVQLLAAGLLAGQHRQDLTMTLLNGAERIGVLVDRVAATGEADVVPGDIGGLETAASLGLAAADAVYSPEIAPDPEDGARIIAAVEVAAKLQRQWAEVEATSD